MAKKKNIYKASYMKEDLQQAVEVRADRMSLRAASKKYGVPRSTISDRVTGRVNEEATSGRPPVLPRELETALVERAVKASERGFGISRQQLMVKAGRLCKNMKIKNPFKNDIPGKDWFSGLKHRHPELTIRSPEALSDKRAIALNPTTVGEYFRELHEVLKTFNLFNKPAQVWNMDETGSRLDHKPTRVVTRKGVKNLTGRVGNSKQSISVLGCVNAMGKSMPPLIIVKGSTEKSLQGYNVADGVEGAIYTFQRKAWMEDVLGEQWFEGIFLRNCGPDRPQLLLLDGHHSHEVLGLLEKALAHDIHVMVIPAGTTSKLQPLDVGCYGPLKAKYSSLISDWMSQSPGNVMSKWHWPRLFKEAWVQALTPKNIENAFKSCGIHPYNPRAVKAGSFLVSEPHGGPLAADVHPLQWVVDEVQHNQIADVQANAPAVLPHGAAYSTLASTEDQMDISSVMATNGNGFRADAFPTAQIHADGTNPHVTKINNDDPQCYSEDPNLQVTSNNTADPQTLPYVLWDHPFEAEVEIETDGPKSLAQPDEYEDHILEIVAPEGFHDIENAVAYLCETPSVPEVLDLSVTSSASEAAPSTSWDAELDSIFALTSESKVRNEAPSKKSTHPRRLLTSGEIMEHKREEQRKKEEKERQKYERMRLKEEKRLKNIQVKELKLKQKNEMEELLKQFSKWLFCPHNQSL